VAELLPEIAQKRANPAANIQMRRFRREGKISPAQHINMQQAGALSPFSAIRENSGPHLRTFVRHLAFTPSPGT